MVKVQEILTNFSIPEIKLSYKIQHTYSFHELPRITTPYSAYKLIKPCFNQDSFDFREETILVCVNNANIPIGFYRLSTGSVNSAHLDPRIIFMTALSIGCTGIVLAHNHPSGNPKPSRHDIESTRIIYNIGKVIGITLLDHIIVTREEYYSILPEIEE